MENEKDAEIKKTKCECSKRYSTLTLHANGYDMQRTCRFCGKVLEEKAPVTTFEQFVRRFVYGKLGRKTKVGNYLLSDDRSQLLYRGKGRDAKQGDDVLALKLADGRIIGNASMLERCGSYRKGTDAPAQRVMFDMNMAMIPFNVFTEAGLNIQTANVIEQGAEEDLLMPKLEWNDRLSMMMPVKVYDSDTFWKKPVDSDTRKIIKCEKDKMYSEKRTKKGRIVKDKHGNHIWGSFTGFRYTYLMTNRLEKRHFVGAMLISVGEKCFLFDIDRNEVKHYRFNPFLAEMPRMAKSIADAYEMLKPKEVVKAEKEGVEVKRQGEWFFIKAEDQDPESKIPKLPQSVIDRWQKTEPNPIEFDISDEYYNTYDSIELVLPDVKKKLRANNVKRKYWNGIMERVVDFNVVYAKWKRLDTKVTTFKERNRIYGWGGELKAGKNRPNTVSKMVRLGDKTYASGIVKHTGREHEPIELEGWYFAVPNTATGSFTISGNID